MAMMETLYQFPLPRKKKKFPIQNISKYSIFQNQKLGAVFRLPPRGTLFKAQFIAEPNLREIKAKRYLEILLNLLYLVVFSQKPQQKLELLAVVSADVLLGPQNSEEVYLFLVNTDFVVACETFLAMLVFFSLHPQLCT